MSLRAKLKSCLESRYLMCAIIFSTLGTLFLAIALCSPYWLESKADSNSSFVRLGLFHVCLRKYVFHSPKYDLKLDGCYSLYGHKYQHFRSWLQPGWFILVQCLTTSGSILSALCLFLLIYMILQKEAEIKIFLCAFIFVFQSLSALSGLLGACVFGAMSFDRSWIQHPKMNHLSWGFGSSIIGSISLGVAACCLIVRTFQMRKALFRDNVAYHIPIENQM